MGNEFSSVEALWSQFEGVIASGRESGGVPAEDEKVDDGQGQDKAATS